MKIFDDLLDELKEENLLEETITETASAGEETEEETRLAPVVNSAGEADRANFRIGETEGVESAANADLRSAKTVDASIKTTAEISADFAEPKKDFAVFQMRADTETAGEEEESAVPGNEKNPNPVSAKAADEAEFFRKRAVEEVSGLQLVEHIFSGVERQQKKIIPKPYDDLNVKKALHAFLQISADAKSPEHAQAEFQLMQETESWYSALSHRDKQISGSHLRGFCETAKPALSSQALIALARFYRNSPYTEAVRSKFDLIITRLFSKDLYDEKREIPFDRDELITHIAGLYADWESVSLYAGDGGEDESEILLAAFKFEDLMTEAQAAESFDELVRNDFFNRLRGFKQSIGERFFAPLVTATAIECNVRVGNRFIELLDKEKENGEFVEFENKYGFLHDQVISDAASKTLQLVDLLRLKKVEPPPAAAAADDAVQAGAKKERVQTDFKPSAAKSSTTSTTATTTTIAQNAADKSPLNRLFAVNKWLLTTAAIVFIASASLFVWAEYFAGDAPDKISQDVKRVNLDNSSLNEYIRDARIGNNTFFAVVLPSWSAVNREKQEEIIKKIASIGANKNFKNVHLLTKDGKSAGVYVDGITEIGN